MSIWDDPRAYINVESQACYCENAADRCDDCGERICERHINKRGNLLYCDACLPWNERVMRWSASREIARVVSKRFAQYVAAENKDAWTQEKAA